MNNCFFLSNGFLPDFHFYAYPFLRIWMYCYLSFCFSVESNTNLNQDLPRTDICSKTILSDLIDRRICLKSKGSMSKVQTPDGVFKLLEIKEAAISCSSS